MPDVNLNVYFVPIIVAFLGLAAAALPVLSEQIRGYLAAFSFAVGIVGAAVLMWQLPDPPEESEYESPQVQTAAQIPQAPSSEPSPPERRTERYSFNRINAHCSSPHEVRWRVNAPAGWRIVGRDFIADKHSGSSKSTSSGVQDLDDSGFFVGGTVANSGNCVRAFGQTIAKDARGRLYAFGTYEIERIAD